MRSFYGLKTHHVVLFLLLAVSGCTSVPDSASDGENAELLQAPYEFSTRIEAVFRKKLAFLEARDIEKYLSKIANRLFSPLKDPIRVELVSATPANYEAAVWALPNGRVFFDVRILQNLRFENEIAAAIAFAWGRAEGTDFRKRLVEEAGKGEPNPEGIWKFSELDDHRAIESTVDRLYKAGYDPRGLVVYFERPPNRSKNEAVVSRIESNQDKARRTISFYAPLLNPIVRTEDFYRMRKKLEKL